LSAPCGNGLLTPSAERLQQLVRPDSIHDVYLVEDVPFARGQFASVRKCTHKLTGQRFAAKVLRKRRRLSDVYHEIAILDAFTDCDRIVHLHEVYETNTEIIIVLELLTGGEMQTLLDVEEFIREDDVIRLMRQILEGLHQLHDNNIAHLDIKPQNLLLTGPFPTCDVKLCDFGISRHVSGGGELREIMGTADYMAPEILNYEPLSLATDMWSIGVLTYALLTGYTPFTGSTLQETYCNITSEEVDFPEDLFHDITATARDFITGLLVKNPSGRRTVHSCLEHPWLAASPAATLSAPQTTALSVPRPDLNLDDKDSGFSSPASSDDETSLPYNAKPEHVISRSNVDNGNSVAPVRRTSSFTTGAYTIENALPLTTKPREKVDNAPVDNAPASKLSSSQVSPQVSLRPLPQLSSLPSLPQQLPSGHTLTSGGQSTEDEVSDVTSEASSSDRTSDMSWEETEFSYRRMSVAQLTDRVWDCFNESEFAAEQVRPWENICTGAVGRAKALFSQKTPTPPSSSRRGSGVTSLRVTPRHM